MATKKSKATAEKPKGKMVANPAPAEDIETANALAEMAVRPCINAAAVMVAYTKPLGEQDAGSLAAVLHVDMLAVSKGDLSRAEAMLFGQAHALQAIFMNLARRSTAQEYMKNSETYLRLALKAQSQCRATLETLAAIKNPPVVFARQANINNGGQQQVNNGAVPPASLPRQEPTAAAELVPPLPAATTTVLPGDPVPEALNVGSSRR
jgi:hypothetical protein